MPVTVTGRSKGRADIMEGWRGYLADMGSHKFVASPEGNGADCHRTWEALMLGCIPIVKRTYMGRDLYGGLPVLYVTDWSEITSELLQSEWEKYVEAPPGTLEWERLFAPYWVEHIKRSVSDDLKQNRGSRSNTTRAAISVGKGSSSLSPLSLKESKRPP